MFIACNNARPAWSFEIIRLVSVGFELETPGSEEIRKYGVTATLRDILSLPNFVKIGQTIKLL